jgi:hypothetical protein
MFDSPTSVAATVGDWPGMLGVKLPLQLVDALKVYDAVRFTEVEYQVPVDIDSLTAENAEAKIRELAIEMLPTFDVPRGNATMSALHHAKRRVTDAAAERVIALARRSINTVIDQLQPEFHEQVEAYKAAINDLPQQITTHTLLNGGPRVVAAYERAQRAVSYFHKLESWIDKLQPLTGGGRERVCRLLRPTTLEQLNALDKAKDQVADQALANVSPLYVAAVRNGVEFRIHTLHEAAEVRRSCAVLSETSSRPLSDRVVLGAQF